VINIRHIIPLPKHDYILSVAHIFISPQGRGRKDCIFKALGERSAVKIKNIYLGTRSPYTNNNIDYAIARLDRKLNVSELNYQNTEEADLPRLEHLGADYALIGYHPDRKKLNISNNCAPIAKINTNYRRNQIIEEFIHSCSVISGMSGGPLIAQTDKGLQAICIQSAEINPRQTFKGDTFDPYINPNVCVRISKKIEDKINAFVLDI